MWVGGGEPHVEIIVGLSCGGVLTLFNKVRSPQDMSPLMNQWQAPSWVKYGTLEITPPYPYPHILSSNKSPENHVTFIHNQMTLLLIIFLNFFSCSRHITFCMLFVFGHKYEANIMNI